MRLRPTVVYIAHWPGKALGAIEDNDVPVMPIGVGRLPAAMVLQFSIKRKSHELIFQTLERCFFKIMPFKRKY